MKPSELYKMPHISETFELYGIRKFLNDDTSEIKDDKNVRVQVRHYVSEMFDERRGYEFMSVWFLDNEIWHPFMICGRAGREGDDDDQHFITNFEVFKAANLYIRSISDIHDRFEEIIKDPDQDIEDLGNFYGVKFKEVYSDKPINKYNIGDIVIAKIVVNHLLSWGEKKYVLTRVKITNVKGFSKRSTYHGMQLDRRWSDNHFKSLPINGDPIFDYNKGQIGASFTDDDVIRIATDEDNARQGYPDA